MSKYLVTLKTATAVKKREHTIEAPKIEVSIGASTIVFATKKTHSAGVDILHGVFQIVDIESVIYVDESQ